MKSFVSYPHEFEKVLFPQIANKAGSNRLVAHFELYKKARHLEGSIIKCGITAEEGFTRFTLIRSLIKHRSEQQLVAFEKATTPSFLSPSTTISKRLQFKINNAGISIDNSNEALLQKAMKEQVNYIPGDVSDTIPDFLIENPEVKIAFLNIDLDEYEATMSALDFLYPRLVEGGILVMDNYYKKEGEFKAVNDYFWGRKVLINNFSINRGPHYIIR
jgi:hypothetical protein